MKLVAYFEIYENELLLGFKHLLKIMVTNTMDYGYILKYMKISRGIFLEL